MQSVSTPQVLSQTIVGSCIDGTQGSIELQYDQDVTMWAYTSDWGSVNVSYGAPGQVFLTDLAPGTYFTPASSLMDPWCSDSLEFVVPALATGCGLVQGSVYADLQGDSQSKVPSVARATSKVRISPQPSCTPAKIHCPAAPATTRS